MSERPPKFMAICIVAMLLGGFGVLGTFMGVAGSSLRANEFKGFRGRHPNRKIVEVQKQMEADVAAVMDRWKVYRTIVYIFLPILSIALISGAILSLQLREVGPRILSPALLLAIPVDLGRTCLEMLLKYSMSGIMARYTHDIMKATVPEGQSLPSGLEGILPGAVQVFSLIAVVAGVVWAAAKICYYVLSFLYLRKSEARALFSAPQKVGPPPIQPLNS